MAYNKIDIDAVEREIVDTLFKGNGTSNYRRFAMKIVNIINTTSYLTDESRKDLLEVLFATMGDFQKIYGDIPTHENVVSYTENYYKGMAKKSVDAVAEISCFTAIPLLSPFWEGTSIQPYDGTIFKGGVARVLARQVLDIPENKNDSAVCDIDAFVVEPVTIQEVATYYSSELAGFAKIPSLSSEWIHDFFTREIDCTLNQVLVSPTHLYITDDCKEALRTGRSSLVGDRNGLFGDRSQIILGQKVYNPSQLTRMFYFLCTGKITHRDVAAHNIEKHNLEALHYERSMLTILRKINTKISIQEQPVIMRRLQGLLRELGILEGNESILHYYTALLQANPGFNIVGIVGGEKDNQKYSNWILSKLIKLKKKEFLGRETEDAAVPKGYTIPTTESKEVTCDLISQPTASFVKECSTFLESIFQQ